MTCSDEIVFWNCHRIGRPTHHFLILHIEQISNCYAGTGPRWVLECRRTQTFTSCEVSRRTRKFKRNAIIWIYLPTVSSITFGSFAILHGSIGKQSKIIAADCWRQAVEVGAMLLRSEDRKKAMLDAAPVRQRAPWSRWHRSRNSAACFILYEYIRPCILEMFSLGTKTNCWNRRDGTNELLRCASSVWNPVWNWNQFDFYDSERCQNFAPFTRLISRRSARCQETTRCSTSSAD